MATIYDILTDLKIPYTEYRHPAVSTSEEVHRVATNVPGEVAKNLFLTNNEETRFYLVSVRPSKRVDLKRLRAMLNETKLHFASPEQLYRYLRLLPGAVSPLGLMYDVKREVTYLIDKELFAASGVYVHPNVNTSTLAIEPEGFRRLLTSWGTKVIPIDVE
jgi:Ala-tRNA(Pro) deacylase